MVLGLTRVSGFYGGDVLDQRFSVTLDVEGFVIVFGSP